MLALLAALALLAPSADDGALVEQVGDAQIDWTARTLSVSGHGPAPVLPEGAGAKLTREAWRKALEAARAEAHLKAMRALESLRAFGSTALGTLTAGSTELAARLEAAVAAFRVVDTRFNADGTVDVVLAGGLTGQVLAGLESGGESPPAETADELTTGVIVNARGIGAVPALAPRLYAEDGELLYGATSLRPDAASRYGVATYCKSLERAGREALVGGRPLLVKAARTTEPQGSDLVVAPQDAVRLRRLSSLLAQGRVIFVLD